MLKRDMDTLTLMDNIRRIGRNREQALIITGMREPVRMKFHKMYILWARRKRRSWV